MRFNNTNIFYNMDIDEVRLRKSVLEERILRLINAYEEETKAEVTNIEYYYSKAQGVYNGLKITVEI